MVVVYYVGSYIDTLGMIHVKLSHKQMMLFRDSQCLIRSKEIQWRYQSLGTMVQLEALCTY